ncbi:MAG TPA: AraC family transcriptional regulator ligand-binding domain-containing protein [Myxococcaceae bacterium]|nr:AraC family transcriptional regulator ligand-binding domain-containing protein [Myxococcaceae bacterium]
MPDNGRPTIVAGLFSRALDVGARCGLDRQHLLSELGIDGALLEDRDNRLPVETFARLWNVISARCPDRPLALDWIATFKITDAGLMGYLVSHLKTVREAAETMGRFGHVVNQAATPELVEGPVTSRVRYSLAPVLLATQHAPEAMMVSLTAFLRGVAGQDFAPSAVRVPYPATARTPALEKFLGTPIRHEGGELSLEFATEVLDRPLPGADPVLAAYLRRQVQEVVQQIKAPNSVSQECARRIAEQLGAGEPSQALIAKQMGMSERTLQRRLQAEGASFNELLEHARRTFACSYLADRKLAAYEVSFLLGYAEPATFFRAFKRWTGKTPLEYRASLG